MLTGEDSPIAQLLLSVVGTLMEVKRSLIRKRQLGEIQLARQQDIELSTFYTL